ncbi:MAG TPA: hypothetical protein PLK34_00415 [Candidatus Pacearchaeota archaeon]|nr:hypothetical protein [Candidatus Pacearchaeota archaeon]
MSELAIDQTTKFILFILVFAIVIGFAGYFFVTRVFPFFQGFIFPEDTEKEIDLTTPEIPPEEIPKSDPEIKYVFLDISFTPNPINTLGVQSISNLRANCNVYSLENSPKINCGKEIPSGFRYNQCSAKYPQGSKVILKIACDNQKLSQVQLPSTDGFTFVPYFIDWYLDSRSTKKTICSGDANLPEGNICEFTLSEYSKLTIKESSLISPSP